MVAIACARLPAFDMHMFARSNFVAEFFNRCGVSPSSRRATRSCNMGDTYRKWYVKACPYADECSATSWKKVQRCTSWESEADCRANLLQHLKTSWNHEPSRKGRCIIDLEATVELAEVEVEDVSKIWFEIEPQPKKQKPSCAASSEEGVRSSSSAGHETGRRREDRDDNDARVARIAAIAVNAVSRGTVPVLPDREMLVDRAVPSSRNDRADNDINELVLVPKAGLLRISENLGKAAVAVGHAIRMFSSATSAFQHQSQTITSMKDEIDTILDANDGE